MPALFLVTPPLANASSKLVLSSTRTVCLTLGSFSSSSSKLQAGSCWMGRLVAQMAPWCVRMQAVSATPPLRMQSTQGLYAFAMDMIISKYLQQSSKLYHAFISIPGKGKRTKCMVNCRCWFGRDEPKINEFFVQGIRWEWNFYRFVRQLILTYVQMIEYQMIVYQQSLEFHSFLRLFVRSSFTYKQPSLIASIHILQHILLILYNFLKIKPLRFLQTAYVYIILGVVCAEGIEVHLKWEHNRKKILVKRIRILKKKQRHLFLTCFTSHPISSHKTAPSVQGEQRRRLPLLHLLPLLLQNCRLLLLLHWGAILLQYNNVLNLPLRSHCRSQSPLQFSDHLQGGLELLLLQDLRLVPLVYGLNGLFDPVLKKEVKGSEGVFYISYLIRPEINEIAVVSPRQFLTVILYLALHEGPKLPPEKLDPLRQKQQLHVHQNDEIVGPRVAVLLETVLECLPLRLPQQPPEEPLGDTDELFVRVVGGAFV